MTTPEQIVFAVLLCGLLVLALQWVSAEMRFLDEEARKDMETFQRLFPGRCPVCAYHRWGRDAGYESRETPEPHVCPEAKC